MNNPVKNSIEVSNLTKIYEATAGRGKFHQPVLANDNISLEIKHGEVFGLLGPNGAGKTTLINQILGLTTPTDGTVLIQGVDVVWQPAYVKSIASYLPQRGIAFEYTEVNKAILFAGQLKGLSKDQARNQADQLIVKLELAEVAHTFFNKLSGGMRRVVGLALALMGQPEILVLDEPTNELDPVRRRRVWDLIRTINR
jgi:ABC-type multidrug transport system ATPase subunit